MKARIGREEFRDAVVWAAKYSASKPSGGLGDLSGLLLRADAEGLTVVGSDGDTWATVVVPASVGDDGLALLPGRLLADVAGKLPTGDVELVYDGSEAHLTCGTLSVTTPTQSAADYPAVPKLPELLGEVDAAAFAAAVSRVAVAASRDDAVPAAQGVYVESAEAGLQLSASDTYRLARTTVPWVPAAGRGGDAAALVPGQALADLARTATGTAGLHVAAGAAGSLGTSWPGHQVTTRLIAAQPVAYERALGLHTAETGFDVDRAELLEVLGRVAVVYEGGKAVPRLRLSLSTGHLDVKVTEGRGRASESVAVAYEGEPREMQCNAHYLAEAVKTAPGDLLRVDLTPTARNSALLRSEADPAWVHLVMFLVDGQAAP